MTSARVDGRPDPGGSTAASATAGWRALRPELIISCVMVIATAVAVYGYAGLAAAFGSVTAWAVVILVLLRVLVPVTPSQFDSRDDNSQQYSQGSFIGFWRQRGVLIDASSSMASYDADLRPTLQHLLAARLAERHGVSLYADPEAARRLLLPRANDGGLWYWLDPLRPAAIINRLERL
jgi:hypothetical protein